ncbi:MAG: shikimate kinase [Parvularculaceae bacterium]|nr:shikimate kinase [Parvularculaceae bacterium]
MASRKKQTARSGPPFDRSVVLVGMMGAGKTTVGRRLAPRLGLPFFDADAEIEHAAGMSVSDLFALHGEASFRRGEAQVIARLLAGPPHVLATGGGAVLDAGTRALIRQHGISVWLRADIDTIFRRATRRPTRPLLQTPDPQGTLAKILAAREALYAEADIVIDSEIGPHDRTVDAVLAAVEALRAKSGAQALEAQ